MGQEGAEETIPDFNGGKTASRIRDRVDGGAPLFDHCRSAPESHLHLSVQEPVDSFEADPLRRPHRSAIHALRERDSANTLLIGFFRRAVPLGPGKKHSPRDGGVGRKDRLRPACDHTDTSTETSTDRSVED